MTTKSPGEKMLMASMFVGLAAAAAIVVWVWLMIAGGSTDSGWETAGTVVVFVAGGVLGLLVYFVPTIVAASRGIPNAMSVAVINVFLGWTFIGWVGALAMAVSGMRDTGAAP